MAHENLKRELQAVDTTEYTEAVGHVILKRHVRGETDSLVTGFAREYPHLTAAAMQLASLTTSPAVGMSDREALIFQDGFTAALVALKEMIDIAALNDIPTGE
jgi:hypothetical protein